MRWRNPFLSSIRKLVLIAGAAATLSGCAQEALLEPLNWLAPRDNARRVADIPYGSDARQTLDIYVPASPVSAPVILFWYGGSWQSGNKDYYRFVGAALAEHGFVAIIPNYRLAPATPFPGFMRDAALAVRWSLDHARNYGGDPARMFLSGHSAGGHIALVLALDETYLRAVALDRRAIAGVVAIAAPTGLENLRGGGLAGVFPASVPDRDFSPIALAPANAAMAPRILLLSGAEDDVIYPSSTARLATALRRAGGRVAEKAYAEIGHLGLLLEMSEALGESGILADIAAFAGLNGPDQGRQLGLKPAL